MRTLVVVLGVLIGACDEPGGKGSAEVATSADGADGADSADSAADSSALETTGADSADSADSVADTGADSAIDTSGAGPDNPTVLCRTDGECAGGELCCTLPLSYLSDCVTAAECHEGLHDACLTDEQCRARSPGEWTVCCHDLGNRNYCAPSRETCQPLMACATPADCAGNATDICCSPHPYYEGSFCTNTFFANPDRDCP